ncbi:SIMPL domain-containing protein [Pseudonocardia hispaniensis]|uniref:SIMPL domain-containing protein n=1 Tax=Pseudonocardia hispaniensis TaxID=904933 RepID=A0ABW1J6S0_9PSEU
MNVDGSEIVTEGTGWHEQLADHAEIAVSFSVTGRDRASAVRDLGRAMAAAEPAMSRPGVKIRSRRLWVRTEWRGRRPAGCRVGEDVALLVTDVPALENILNALITAEPTTLSGPHWTLEDPSVALRAAQHNAVTDARRRAEGYAAALGGTLGPLRRLVEAPDHGLPVAFRAAHAEAAVVDVQELGLEPEPVRVTARCTATWALG